MTSSLPESVAKLHHVRAFARLQTKSRHAWPLVLLTALGFALDSPPAKSHHVPLASTNIQPVPPPPTQVFLVEHRSGTDLYSNGLEIQLGFENSAGPRRYRSFARGTLDASPPLSNPAGIVFHTTESLMAPIEPGQASALSRTRADLLAHIRRDRLYNFFIDRFGQVFRVVPEDQTAFHAGNSVWADFSHIYVDLNDSFIGVAFELKTGESATEAQLHAGRLLTDLLRARYRIEDANCVTHAQVSVNPSNMRLGYHTDWGGFFPFSVIGLTAGYRTPVAAVELFGFAYDEHLLAAIGGRPWAGLLAAEQQILIDAAAHGSLGPRYRTTLQQRYQTLRRKTHERT